MKTDSVESSHDRGMILMGALTILLVLMVVGVGIRTMLQNDYRMLANLRVATESFYISVAGIEWSKAEISRMTDFPPFPVNQTKNFSNGEFAASFLSSTAAGPLAAKILVRSVGSKGSSQHVLQAQLTKSYDLSDAALALRGNGSRINLGGGEIFISGADHHPSDGSVLSGSVSRSAVSTSDNALLERVLQALGEPPRPGVLDSGEGAEAITLSDFLSTAFVTQWAAELCASPTVTVHAMPGDGSLVIQNQTWGAEGAPQLHCIEGLSTPGDAVDLVGFSGAGLIVIRDADLHLSGTFRWEGLVLVTGSEVGVKAMGSDPKVVFGAVVINESGIPEVTHAIFDVDGYFRLLFSRKALNQTATLIPAVSLSSAYASLPSLISQDYWRTLTP